MISGGVVGWEKAEDVPCSCLCIMSLYFAYKMIMLGSDTTREVRAGCVGDTSIIIMRYVGSTTNEFRLLLLLVISVTPYGLNTVD